MGIDWEEILDAEGADMARAYEDSLPEEDCGITNHYASGTKFEDDVVGSYIYDTLDGFDGTLCECGFYDKDASVGEPGFDDPYWKLENKTNDELIEECIKFSQEAKHVKSVLKDAGRDIDTLFDYLDSRVLLNQNVSAETREQDRRIIESKLKYEEESMGDDELREKCRAMTRDDLMDKHIDIEGMKDAAVCILLFIEDVIKELRTEWYSEFEGKQDLKDLLEKYKEPLPETREMAEKIAEQEAAQEKAAKEKAAREKLKVKCNTEKQDMIEKDESISPAPDDYEFSEEDELPLD